MGFTASVSTSVRRVGLAALLCQAAALQAFAAESVAGPRIDFNRDVRPILSDRCFACHGPDAEDRQAGLRLDDRGVAIAALESGGTAIVPGKPEASEILARIASTDPAVIMPPPHVNKPVTPAEAEILRRWIAEGAEYRGHWAFERVQRPVVPVVKDAAWPKTPIDRFIQARLEHEGLAPNAEADRTQLARRVALDLTGRQTPQPGGSVGVGMASGVEGADGLARLGGRHAVAVGPAPVGPGRQDHSTRPCSNA